MNEYIKALQELADSLNKKVEEVTKGVEKVQDILNEVNKDIDLRNEAKAMTQAND